MNEAFVDFLTILLPTYFFFYMAITLIHRNNKSMLNRIAAYLMLAFLFYFLGEYIKTSLLPQYQMQIVLYANAPMLLLIICFLVHLSILIGSNVTAHLKRWLPFIYTAPFLLWFVFLLTKDHRVLYNAEVTDGGSPLDPLFLFFTLMFISGYILLSVIMLAVCWYRTKEAKLKQISQAMLFSLFSLFAWFFIVTWLLQSESLTARNAMIFYFIGYMLWAVSLRYLIGKHDIMPDYRKRFHILFKSAPTAIMLLDKSGAIREMNPRANQWFAGISAEEIPNHFQFDGEMRLCDILALLNKGQDHSAHREIRMSKLNDGHLDLMMGIELIDGGNEALYVMHLTDVTSLKDTERRLLESERGYKHLAHHDSLTGLYNRTVVQEQLQQKIANNKPFALALIDLDNFKSINDTYGHLIGDSYLKHIANSLNNSAKLGDLTGRIGGDEFVLIVPYSEESDVKELIDSRLS